MDRFVQSYGHQEVTRHINVELCVSTLSGLKYQFKDACEGRDGVPVQLQIETVRHDEMKNYVVG